MATTKTLKILIVDDFDMIRMLLKKSLTDIGFSNFEEAGDGEEGFNILSAAYDAKQPFDLVFLDWNMPKMSGISFLERCRSMEHFQQIPIIMITAEREQKSVMQALKAGVTDYIVKPFSSTMLLEKLKRHKILSDVGQVS